VNLQKLMREYAIQKSTHADAENRPGRNQRARRHLDSPADIARTMSAQMANGAAAAAKLRPKSEEKIPSRTC
jgi:hypothetical protein